MKHRRSLKLALAALLIVLPLILSGCYVEPNNISAGNQAGSNQNFPVYQPNTNVPTAAPATNAPVSAPTINTGVVTLPTSNVNNWQTPSAMTTVGRVTSVPVTLPPTATPTATPQGSLKLGSQGEDVRTVQRKLKELGFYKGSVDGDFGEGTETAVKAFQKQYGLTVDGKVGPNTLAKLVSARQTAKPAVTPTPKPTATPAYENTYLRLGDSGTAVRRMQERLISLGYLAGTATGSFDAATESGVIAFQNRHTSYSDGVAGPKTLQALYSSSAKSTSTPSGIIGVSLKQGSEGPAVRALQNRLKTLGYYKGTVDGDFGAGTTDAVKAFQQANGLKVDGVAGGGTLNKLFASSAKSGSSSLRTATPRPTATPYRTATPLPENIYVLVTPNPRGEYVTLRRGMYGDLVKAMQTALKNQGYFTGTPDGYFGDATERAVESFQRTNGLNVDGAAGPATLRVLYEGAFPYGS